MAEDDIGPVDYLIVEFKGDSMTGEGLLALVDLVDRGLIRILDLMIVRKDKDGTISAIDISDVDRDDVPEVAVFEGASSGLLDPDDAADAGSVLEPDTTAAILLYENRWAAPLAAALRRSGAQLVARGGVPMDELVAMLEAAG
jgi:Family of unknown function (DUF6325)